MKKIAMGALITAALIAFILAVGYGVKPNYQNVSANWPDVTVGRATSTDTGAFQIDPAFRLNRDLILTVRALVTNTGVIRIGNSAGTAVSTSTSNFTLYPGESLGLFIEASGDIWFTTAVKGEGIEYFTESQTGYSY